VKLEMRLAGGLPRVVEIFVGESVRGLPALLTDRFHGRSLYWIWDETVWSLWGSGWDEAGEDRRVAFDFSEGGKRLSGVEALARELARRGADRRSVLVAVGGGVAGDVTGFLASIYMRGIPHVQVPTTLLAQVDSSVGGKTGVNLPEGKNLVGAFHQPELVFMDPRFLETLPLRELRQGMAEVVKTALVGDEKLWAFLESFEAGLKGVGGDPEALAYVISSCCRLKASVVEADEREGGRRRVLNLGHTVGHAVERSSGYTIPHGDAVAMGLVAAARLGVALGETSPDLPDRLEALCRRWGLPVAIPSRYSPEALVDALKTDKKRLGRTLHFILPVRPGQVLDYPDPDLDRLKQVLRKVGEAS